jgi:hypothetical protein
MSPWRNYCFLSLGLGTTEEVFSMCDYSLHNVKSRPAKVGDKLTTHNFNTGTRGFAAPEDARTAVCVLPGTELAFATEVRCGRGGFFGWKVSAVNHTTAIFRQINKDEPLTHHDALCRTCRRARASTMPTHKFWIGQLEQVAPATSRNVPGGTWKRRRSIKRQST